MLLNGDKRPSPFHLSLIPVLLSALLVMLFTVINLPLRVYEPSWLFPALTVLFSTLIPYAIAVLAAFVYLRRGISSALLLGSGLVAFGTGALCSSLVMTTLSINSSVTAYNFGRLLSSGLYLYSAILIMQGESPLAAAPAGSRRRLLAFYGTAFLLLPLITGLALTGALPVFFIQGAGPTTVRQVTLELSKALFAASAALLLVRYYRIRQPFAWWFALGLILLLIGTTGVFFERAVGSLLSWAGRFATYLGNFYLLLAVSTLYRQARRRGIPMESALLEFFTDAEARYRLLVENSPDLISRYDHDLRLLYINPAVERIIGAPPSFFIGKTIEEVGLDEENRIKMRTALEAVLRGEPEQRVVIDFETAYGKKSFDSSYFPDRNSSGKVVGALGIARDITALLESQRIMHESEEKFSRAFSASPTFMFVSELETGRILEANEALSQLCGFAREEMIGRTSLELGILQQDYCSRIKNVVMRKGEIRNQETSIRVKTGGTRQVIFSCAVIEMRGTNYVVCSGHDITERKRTEQALKEKEELFRTVLENSRDGINMYDLECRCYVYISPAQAELTGFSIEELRDLPAEHARERCHPEDRERLEAYHEQVIAGKNPAGPVEYRWKVKSGEYRWFSDSRRAILDPQGKTVALVGVSRDITGRKRAEQALREWEAIYRGMFHDSHTVMLLINPESGEIVEANPAACAYYGYDRDRIQSMKMSEIIVLPEVEVKSGMPQAMNDGQNHFESRHRLASGEIREVEVSGSPLVIGGRTLLFSIVLDVTERKFAEQALAEKEELFRTVLENSRDGIHLLDLERKRYVFMSPAQEKLTGFSLDELNEFSEAETFERLHPEDRERMRQYLDQVINAQDSGAPVEYRWKVKSGEYRWFSDSRRVILDRQGRPVALVGVSRDITDRKQLDESILLAREEAEARAVEAEEANRAKSLFLSHMSHELRTPLNGIIGMNHLAMIGSRKPKVREYLGYVHQSAEHLLELVNELLDLSRIEAGRVDLRKESFDLPELLESILRPFRLQARQRGLAFQPDFDNLPQLVRGDPGRLRQVLINLLGNAVKFTNAGEVEFTVRVREQAPDAVHLHFSVRDTGIGIAPERLESIFDSFGKLKVSKYASFGGTGLGLAISRQLVELMGGRIWARSSEGEGSTFHVSLTMETGTVKTTRPMLEFPAASPARQGLRILLAEDEAINRLFMQNLLRQRGHKVEAVGNGQEALKKLAVEKFDLVLMDVSMPVMGGEEAVRAIRSGSVSGADPRMRVVALTAHAIRGDCERFLAAGFDGHLTKPVNLARLQELLEGVQPLEDPKPTARGPA